MKRRLLSAFLAVMMVLTMAPMAFAAEDETADSTSSSDSGDTGSSEVAPAVAKIGDIGYATLQAAVDAAKTGETVEMLTDVDLKTSNAKFYTSKNKATNVTVDLGGHTLICSASSTITVAATDWTIQNGIIKNTYGKTVNSGGAINVPSASTVTLKGGENGLKVESVGAGINIRINNGIANVTIEDGVEINGEYGAYLYGSPKGYNRKYKGKTALTVNGGSINGLVAGVAVWGPYKTNTDASATLTVNGGTISSDTGYGIAGTGEKDYLGDTINVAGGIITSAKDVAIYHPEAGKISISNGTVSGVTGGVQMCSGSLEVTGGTISATGNGDVTSKTGDGSIPDGAAVSIVDRAYPGGTPSATITGGYFKSADGVNAVQAYTWSNNTKSTWAQSAAPMSITGGYFTTNPTDYCAVGLTGISTGREDYPYTVGTLPANTENKIDAATDTGNNAVNADAITNSEDRNAAQDAAEKVKFEEAVADENEITETDKQRGLTALANKKKVQVDSNGKIQGNTTVTIVKEVFLDIAVTDFKVQGLEDKDVSVTMDITPKYNLIATTDKDNRTAENSVTLETKPLTVSEATKVSVTIPAFANKKVYIDHANGKNLYVAKADANGKIEFTTNGFSPFTFTLSNPNVVAEVNGNAYKSLQEAANAANNGDEITVVRNKTHDLTFTATKSVKVKNETGDDVTVKFNGTDKKFGNGETETFSYTKPSSGGSSGGSSSGKTTYKVTTSAVNNGGVNASPSSAEKGATITITLSPDKGYKLDKLTVTDGSGKTVSTVKKSDTVYTFTMPASAVKVGVSYVKATETPSETKFNDVSANDWFASAVDYVTGKGMMNGTADNTFSPKANTTRGMVVTVLYRLENQPSTSAASFTDVASGAYYANAVAWANANGIVSGYGSGKFGPNDKVTREQLAAILYRYAQYKKYDVSVGEDTNILSYNDAQSISSYAIPAIQWACGAGVVTGKSGSKLDPKGNATRAEVAAMLMRFCENVK